MSVTRGESKNCPLCLVELDNPEDPTIECPGCQTLYHEDCAKELGGCSTLGCVHKGEAPRGGRWTSAKAGGEDLDERRRLIRSQHEELRAWRQKMGRRFGPLVRDREHDHRSAFPGGQLLGRALVGLMFFSVAGVLMGSTDAGYVLAAAVVAWLTLRRLRWF